MREKKKKLGKKKKRKVKEKERKICFWEAQQ